MRVLGIEGTAWAASAAVFEFERDGPLEFERADDTVFIESDPYEPESGGIHPREAAEHMGEAIPRVVDAALSHARSRADVDGSPPVDAVAFSRGPGLGPCLRIVGTAARSLAGTLDVPLVGVNHMVAHLEIGRYQSGFDSPVCLNASGANAHLLGYHNGRYRVLGETMDTGVGNAIDKFTRHVGWSHPGGPKVEKAAKDGEYVDLPYVVKGMDFSFSGIMSAAKQAYDDGVSASGGSSDSSGGVSGNGGSSDSSGGVSGNGGSSDSSDGVSGNDTSEGPSDGSDGASVEDVCFSLQEHVFAMLTEVAERALSLTGTDELVLGGGVGQNERLREMLAEMCEDRGASFYAPDPRFLRDNAGMIAVLGAKMLLAGDTLAIEESTVDPNFRPDQVPVTWRGPEESVARALTAEGDVRGAEAVVAIADDHVVKRRLPKRYRHPELDARLRRERTVAEARLTSEARRHGVPTPLVLDVDLAEATLTLQRVGSADLSSALTAEHVETVGEYLATLHRERIVHGDPTTRNVRVREAERPFLIDFGLGYHSGHVEDHAMDLHVFEQSVAGTADDPEPLLDAFEAGYEAAGDPEVLARLRQIEGRGRYQ